MNQIKDKESDEILQPDVGRPRSFRKRSTFKSINDLWRIMWYHPHVLVVPLVLFGLLLGLGLWGVISASNSSANSARTSATASATEVATSFELQIEQTFAPAVTLQIMIEKDPYWEYWQANFIDIAEYLISQTPNGSLYNIQLQPFGQVRIIYPLRPADQTQYGKDLLLYPPRRALSLELIALHRQDVSVTYLTAPQNLSVVAVRQPIFINNTAPNETFGYYFDGENYTVPVVPQNVSYPPILPTGWPAGYKYNCSVCYNASTPTQNSSRWWGFVALFINLQEVTDGQDSRLKTLTDNGYSYALYAPINSSDTSQYQLVSQHGDINFESAELVDVLIPGQVQQTWQLWVQPLAGWYPSWTAPLIATVVILSVLISALLFTAMMYHVRQGALLTETKLTNEELARTTAVLKEEQVRMSTLIARQYELLSCLDDKNPSVVTAKAGLTLEHIGEVRRLVNDAALKGLKVGQDQIQIKELLGEGAFGKVYKGLWRGTEVAIKTIILPANMAGAEKREKMAVMEAAISSSLMHPNIVSTYTYSIRPLIDGIFCEAMDNKEDFANQLYPSEENNLVAPSQPHLPSSGVMQPSTRTSLSRNSSTGVHSFEVRLVLEYCDKGSLNDAVSSKVFYLGTELCFSAVLETAADVAKAMVHMHAAGVLHSDLKAHNIMLKSSGQEGRGFVAKVADFGMSSQVAQQAEAHVSSMFQGTITHMAPETLMEGRASKAGDVYSFGILMWELLTAGDPYAEVPMALLGYAVTKLCRRPKFPAFAPHDYVQLAQRCWLPNPKDRPSFEEILENLQAMMEMHSPTCRPLQVPSIKRNFDKVHSGSYMNIKVIAGHSQDTALKASSSYQYDHDQRPQKRAYQNPRAAGTQTAHHHHILSTMPPSDAVRDDLIHLQTLSIIGSHMAPWSAATPAQDVLAMLDNFISGNQVDVGDAVKLREVILGVGKDWYQPPPALKQRLSIVSSRSEQRAADKTLRSLLVSAVDPTAMLHFQEAMAIQEEVDETGATCEGQGQEVPTSESVQPLQARSKALPVEEASPALLEVEDTTFLHVKEPSEEVLLLLSTIDEWQFDSFALDEVSQGWPLSMLTFAILSRHGLVSPRHHVKGVQLATYLRKLEEGYGDNPYHCRAHAADVVRTLYCLLTRGSVLKTAWLPQDMDMAMIVAMLAAALHDYQHKGVNNDFLIKSSDELAVLYNDSSPMENHHLAAAFALLKEDSCNFLQHMPVRQKSEMRKMVIEAVMATDMKQHFSLTSLFNTKFSNTTETAVGHATVVRRSLMSSRDLSAGLDGELRSLVLQIAMKCADLGALAAARKVHVQWVQRLEEEFFRQGDQEHRLSLQKSPLMDRSKNGLSKAQPQFFSVVALPLFKSFVAIFPDCSPLLENTNGNLDMWLCEEGKTAVP